MYEVFLFWWVRGWNIDSHSGNSAIILQRIIDSDETLSLLIKADEKNDVQHVGNDGVLLKIRCFHNIGIDEKPEIHIKKQLVYTVSFFVFFYYSFIFILVYAH